MIKYKRKHSVFFEPLKRRYGELFTKDKVYIAYKKKHWITAEEYKEITGENVEDYEK